MRHLIESLREFASERGWSDVHTPKNLSMALSVEVSEIAEHFQWLTGAESSDPLMIDVDAVGREIGDAMIYLAMLADSLDLDPLTEARAKLKLNAIEYPKPNGVA